MRMGAITTNNRQSQREEKALALDTRFEDAYVEKVHSVQCNF